MCGVSLCKDTHTNPLTADVIFFGSAWYHPADVSCPRSVHSSYSGSDILQKDLAPRTHRFNIITRNLHHLTPLAVYLIGIKLDLTSEITRSDVLAVLSKRSSSQCFFSPFFSSCMHARGRRDADVCRSGGLSGPPGSASCPSVCPLRPDNTHRASGP